MSRSKTYTPGIRADAYRSCIDAFNRGDIETGIKFAAENAVVYEVCSLPFGGFYRGIEGFRNLMLNLAAQFHEANIVLENLVEYEDNGLFVIGRLIGRAKGTMAPIDEYYHEVMLFEGPDPSRFTTARIAFCDDVRLLRAMGYDSFPNLQIPRPAPIL